MRTPLAQPSALSGTLSRAAAAFFRDLRRAIRSVTTKSVFSLRIFSLLHFATDGPLQERDPFGSIPHIFFLAILGFPMKLFMHVVKLFVGDVGIDLGGGNAGVAQHDLDGADVRAVAEQVGGEAVADDVRGDFLGNAGLDGVKFYNPFY